MILQPMVVTLQSFRTTLHFLVILQLGHRLAEFLKILAPPCIFQWFCNRHAFFSNFATAGIRLRFCCQSKYQLYGPTPASPLGVGACSWYFDCHHNPIQVSFTISFACTHPFDFWCHLSPFKKKKVWFARESDSGANHLSNGFKLINGILKNF